MTWSSLDSARQELDSMKDLRQQFHQMREDNQKLTEIVADSRGEIRELTLAVKNLEMQNIQQQKRFEDMVRKMEREIKRVENKVPQAEVSRAEEVPRKYNLPPPTLELMGKLTRREARILERRKLMEDMTRKEKTSEAKSVEPL